MGEALTGATPEAREEVEQASGAVIAISASPSFLKTAPLSRSGLSGSPVAPAVLFCRGDPAALNGPATNSGAHRHASPTRYGIGVAAQLGAELSAAGVNVVSGTGPGYRRRGSRGCLRGGSSPIGSRGRWLDEPYPRRHARLWERVRNSASSSPRRQRGANREVAISGAQSPDGRSQRRGRGCRKPSPAVGRGTGQTRRWPRDPLGAVPGSIRSARRKDQCSHWPRAAFPVRATTDILIALSREGAEVQLPKLERRCRARGAVGLRTCPMPADAGPTV